LQTERQTIGTRIVAELLADGRDPTLPADRRSQRSCQVATLAVVQPGGGWRLVPARCRSWGCVQCARFLAARWQHTLAGSKFAAERFVTITLDPQRLAELGILRDYEAQRDFLRRKLQSLWQWLRRRYGKLRYFRALEFHSGKFDKRRRIFNHRLHVHALIATEVQLPCAGFSPFACQRDPSLAPYDRARDVVADRAAKLGLGLTKTYSLTSETVREGKRDAVLAYVWKYCCKQKSGSHRYRLRMATCSRCIRHARNPFLQENAEFLAVLWPALKAGPGRPLLALYVSDLPAFITKEIVAHRKAGTVPWKGEILLRSQRWALQS